MRIERAGNIQTQVHSKAALPLRWPEQQSALGRGTPTGLGWFAA